MIETRVAKHLAGENLYFGHRTLQDLLGRETLTGLTAIAVTGRRPTEAQRETLDAVSVTLCSADPRIWPLKLTRLASSYGSTLAGYCAGQVAIEGNRIGPWVIGYAAAALAELREAVGDRVDDAELVAGAVADLLERCKRIPGYGVPLRPSDERMDALCAWVVSTGRDGGVHWRLQEALSESIRRDRGIQPNGCIGIAAVLLDAGYAASETSALSLFVNQNVFSANAVEAAHQKAPEMQRMPESSVEYVGRPRRSSPRSR